MTFPVVGSNIPSSYQISNSLRFNDGDSASLNKTFGSAGNRKIFTWSGWIKRSLAGGQESIFLGYSSATQLGFSLLTFSSNNTLSFAGASYLWLQSSQVFRDASAWYHIVLAVDTTQATADNRIKLYVNGTEITSFGTRNNPSLNDEFAINDATTHNIGSRDAFDSSDRFDGYLAEINFIDGQALSPTSFGEFDEDSGVWKPKQYAGTYGTNGFYLKFNNTGNMGEDSSGNDNTWTPTNLSGTTDVTTDTPTNNFATLNPLNGIGTFSEGNVKYDTGTSGSRSSTSTMGVSSGKWYSEVKITSSNGNQIISIVSDTYNSLISGNRPYLHNDSVSYSGSSGNKFIDGTSTSYGASYTTNDIIGIALNLDDDEITFYKNGASQGTITTKTFDDNTNYLIAIGNGSSGSSPIVELNTGNPSFSISSGNSDDNGYGNFEYAPPSGYLALCTQNLATALSPTIDDGSQYFNTVLYTGNGVDDRSITGVGFQPDFVWGKNRSSAGRHTLADSTRGATQNLWSERTDAEGTELNVLQAFESDGFEVGSDTRLNASGANFVAWNWKANGGTTSSNTDGSITSTVQANTTAGFSIVTWTGDGTEADIGHGLGVNPDMLILKDRDASANWLVYHSSNGENKYLKLNETSASSGTVGQNLFSGNNSLTFGVGSGYSSNTSGNKMVAYCFAEIEGYSKFGSYTGNGATPGPFIYTGFRPAWVMIKRTSGTGNWEMHDNKRPTFNATDFLLANSSNAENTGADAVDFYSNGFKCNTGSRDDTNFNGSTYIYMAFAENPFVTSGAVPVTAR